MRRILNRLRRNQVWNIGVYVEDMGFSFPDRIGSPIAVLNSRRIRTSKRHRHTTADPFLFQRNGYLYMFYESQTAFDNGVIEAVRTKDLVDFEKLGEVLREPWHLSYPFVFEESGSVYLIPESVEREEVALYHFDGFPHRPRKVRTLLRGEYHDSSMICHGDHWYLFTASTFGLEVWITDDPADGELMPHPLNPISTHPKYYRCGGGPIRVDDRLFRVAQDVSAEYGKNISILEIDELSPQTYSERVVADDYFQLDEEWNSRGGHHLSVVDFNGKRVVAVDGKQDDLLVNKLLSLVYLMPGGTEAVARGQGLQQQTD